MGVVVRKLPGDRFEILVAEDRYSDEVSARGEVSAYGVVAGLRGEVEGLVVGIDHTEVLVDRLSKEAVDIVLLHKADVAHLDTEAAGNVLVPNKEIEGQHSLAVSQDGHTSFQVLNQLDSDTRIANYALLRNLGFPVPQEKETNQFISVCSSPESSSKDMLRKPKPSKLWEYIPGLRNRRKDGGEPYTQPRDSHLCPPWLRDLEIEFQSKWNQMSCHGLLGRRGRDGRERLVSLNSFHRGFCGYGRLLQRRRRGYC